MVQSRDTYADVTWSVDSTSGTDAEASVNGAETRPSQTTGSHGKDHAMPSFMNENMIPTVFRWEHGGDEVFVTGTFTNWEDHIPMHRSGNDFTHIQMLPRVRFRWLDRNEATVMSAATESISRWGVCTGQGKHAFKFIVDGEWRWDPEQDTVADGAQNINNFIDLSHFKRDDEKEEEYPGACGRSFSLVCNRCGTGKTSAASWTLGKTWFDPRGQPRMTKSTAMWCQRTTNTRKNRHSFLPSCGKSSSIWCVHHFAYRR